MRRELRIDRCDIGLLVRRTLKTGRDKIGFSRHGSGAGEKTSIRMEQTMKVKIAIFSTLVIFALALCLSVTTTPAAPKAPAPAAVPAAAPQPAAAPAALPEPHPEIREALGAMRRAKEHMEHAAHDFGGHRVEAIQATDAAIRQLELCLKFDKD
jgi:hypothetical protein